jgi:hypothetical protein
MSDEQETQILTEDGYAVGRLIAFALRSSRPSKEGEYKQLIDQYLYEPKFADAVHQVLEGMGLQVLNAGNPTTLKGGLVLSCTSHNSPFAPNIESHARGLDKEQRVSLGVIHIAVMSFFYPQEDEEDEEDMFRSRSGTPSEIAEDIRRICETLRQSRDVFDWDEVPADHISLAYEHFLALAPAPPRQTGYIGKTTQVGLVNFALSELYKNGFLAIDGGDGINTRYVSLPKYRVYTRRFASHKVARLVREARQKMTDKLEEGANHG